MPVAAEPVPSKDIPQLQPWYWNHLNQLMCLSWRRGKILQNQISLDLKEYDQKIIRICHNKPFHKEKWQKSTYYHNPLLHYQIQNNSFFVQRHCQVLEQESATLLQKGVIVLKTSKATSISQNQIKGWRFTSNSFFFFLHHLRKVNNYMKTKSSGWWHFELFWHYSRILVSRFRFERCLFLIYQ